MNWLGIRDAALFISGLLGIYHETLVTNYDRPVLLGAFLVMLGLPIPLRADERRRRKNGNGNGSNGG